MEYSYIKQSVPQCTNCGKKGHNERCCKHPPTSYGVINISMIDPLNMGIEKLFLKSNFSQANDVKYQVVSRKYPDIKYLFTNKINFHNNQNYKLDVTGLVLDTEEKLRKFTYYQDKIMYMMVSRRYSLGFVDFVRGDYDPYSILSMTEIFGQMYPNEKDIIRTNTYDDLLYMLLGRDDTTKEEFLVKIYEDDKKNRYCNAKLKHDLLTNSFKVPLSLSFYIEEIKPDWNTPEWGFPKGRRDRRSEVDITCAKREFEEETGYVNGEYHILNKIDPAEECMTGTNGVKYRHIYYLSVDNIGANIDRSFDYYEIGEIKWFTYSEAIEAIRPYHKDKKDVLSRVNNFLLNALIECAAV